MKDVVTLDAKVINIDFAHQGTSMNYSFMNQLSATYHAPTLSQLISSQVVFV
jgi:hypothetical protein